MGRFSYKAYDTHGAIDIGEVSAATRENALEALARRGQIPFELDEAISTGGVPWWQREVFGSNRLSSHHLATFTRELSSLVKAEIPIDEALRIVAVQPLLPVRIRHVTNQCLERVIQGEPLSAALAAQGAAFPEYYVRLVKAGEASGAFSDVLADLAKVVERAAETRARVGSALVYPAVLLFAAMVALAVIVTVLIPTILPIFEDAGAAPPALIRILSKLQHLGSEHLLLILTGMALAIVAPIAFAQNPAVRIVIDKSMLLSLIHI